MLASSENTDTTKGKETTVGGKCISMGFLGNPGRRSHVVARLRSLQVVARVCLCYCSGASQRADPSRRRPATDQISAPSDRISARRESRPVVTIDSALNIASPVSSTNRQTHAVMIQNNGPWEVLAGELKTGIQVCRQGFWLHHCSSALQDRCDTINRLCLESDFEIEAFCFLRLSNSYFCHGHKSRRY